MTHPTAILSDDKPPSLLVSRHKRTHVLRFPPLSAQSPLAPDHETVSLPGRGTVYSFSVIHSNPKAGTPPFAVGYVNLPGPIRLFGRIVGKGLAIGEACEVAPDAEFGYVFNTVQR